MTYEGELYTRIMEKLKFEPGLHEENITVSVKDKGVILLGGKVRSYAEKYLAEEAVKKIENVKGVANELEVDLSTIYKTSDAEIAESVISAFRSNIFVPDERIKVTVEKGHVTLTGEVEYYFQREHAEKAVRNIKGILDINNNIIVKSNIKVSEVKEKIIQEFERNARIDASNIYVEVDGNTVTLKGTVRNFDEEEEARKAAWSVPGVTKVNNFLDVNW